MTTEGSDHINAVEKSKHRNPPVQPIQLQPTRTHQRPSYTEKKKKNTRKGRSYHKTRNYKLHYTIVQPYDTNTGSIEDNQWPLRVMNTHAQTKMVEAPPPPHGSKTVSANQAR